MPYYLFSFFLLLMLAAPAMAQDVSKETRTAIEATLRDYAEGADARDTERVGRALHASSVQYVPRPQGLLPIPHDQYLQLLEAERIGGEDRTLTIHAIEVTNDEVAQAKMELQGAMHFTQYVSLVKLEGAWKIVSIVTSVK